jgi:hypothetical protein
MAEGSPALWEYAEALIRSAIDKGYLAETDPFPNNSSTNNFSQPHRST